MEKTEDEIEETFNVNDMKQEFKEQKGWEHPIFFNSQSTRGLKIFGNGREQPYLKLCLLKASHEQEIKSTLFCLLILIWSRDRQFKFDPLGEFWLKKYSKIYQLCMSLAKTNFSQS